MADIDSDKITSLELNQLVKEKETEWQGDMLGKVKVNYGGEQEKNQESFISLVVAFHVRYGRYFLYSGHSVQ